AQGNRWDVPVLGIWSVGRFLRPYLEHLVETGDSTTITIGGVDRSAREIRDELKASQVNVWEDLIGNGQDSINAERHEMEYALYHNSDGVIDGNAYGFLINAEGPAVDGFADGMEREKMAGGITIVETAVLDHSASVKEVIALCGYTEDGGPGSCTKAQNGPVGGTLQVLNTHPEDHSYLSLSSNNLDEAEYVGNVVSNAQLLVAKASGKG
ncbi:unnamed protein product, partial [Chrysoparadoxa australica]